jgi:hypothetical protein
LPRSARNDAADGDHCEEQGDEAIPGEAHSFPIFPVEPGIFADFPTELRFCQEKGQVNQALAGKFPWQP